MNVLNVTKIRISADGWLILSQIKIGKLKNATDRIVHVTKQIMSARNCWRDRGNIYGGSLRRVFMKALSSPQSPTHDTLNYSPLQDVRDYTFFECSGWNCQQDPSSRLPVHRCLSLRIGHQWPHSMIVLHLPHWPPFSTDLSIAGGWFFCFSFATTSGSRFRADDWLYRDRPYITLSRIIVIQSYTSIRSRQFLGSLFCVAFYLKNPYLNTNLTLI